MYIVLDSSSCTSLHLEGTVLLSEVWWWCPISGVLPLLLLPLPQSVMHQLGKVFGGLQQQGHTLHVLCVCVCPVLSDRPPWLCVLGRLHSQDNSFSGVCVCVCACVRVCPVKVHTVVSSALSLYCHVLCHYCLVYRRKIRVLMSQIMTV